MDALLEEQTLQAVLGEYCRWVNIFLPVCVFGFPLHQRSGFHQIIGAWMQQRVVSLSVLARNSPPYCELCSENVEIHHRPKVSLCVLANHTGQTCLPQLCGLWPLTGMCVCAHGPTRAPLVDLELVQLQGHCDASHCPLASVWIITFVRRCVTLSRWTIVCRVVVGSINCKPCSLAPSETFIARPLSRL